MIPSLQHTATTSANGLKVAVVGASMGGLGIANVLHRLGAAVTVLESFPQNFERRGGALGGVDPDLFQTIRYGEGGTGGGGKRPKTLPGHGYFYGDLWRYLADGLPEDAVQFGVDVTEILDAETEHPRLVVTMPDGGGSAGGDESSKKTDTATVTTLGPFDLVVGADGGRSTIRKYVTDQVPQYSGYTLWRGLVLREHVGWFPSSRRTFNGYLYETLGFPCPSPQGPLANCGIYMSTPESEISGGLDKNRQVGGAKDTPEWFLPFVKEMFRDSQTTRFWELCATHGKVSPHPVFEMAADQVVANRIVLVGDAAHMSSPKTGAGAYTALTDAVHMGLALEQSSDLKEALRLFNNDVVTRGKDLVRRSRIYGSGVSPRDKEPVSPLQVLDQLRAKEKERSSACSVV
jgi:2-polyprenyl-6-methoxyphenol hydroxylase-like FAD-dependent oxidoreductase